MSTLKRSMFKETIVALFVSLCVMVPFLVNTGSRSELISIPEEQIPLMESCGELIRETDADINIVPDKYNCGAKGDLMVAELGQSFDTMYLKKSANKNIIDFAYCNTKVSGVINFDNIDFSKYPVCVNNEKLVGRNIKLIFNNCVFGSFSTGVQSTNLSYEFNNCTIKSFYGSNATFSNCLFGGSFNDALVPFQEVKVYDSYFCDMATDNPASAGIHTDGTQIYGHRDAKVKNILFSNCRFEIPAIKTVSNSASINACVMIQLEYNDAENIRVENCIMNGGGYTIYAHTKSDKISLSNISFENIQIGVAHLFNDVYPHISNGVSIENMTETANLYVGSVWREANETKLSVSNDTGKDRELLVYADGKEYSYKIPACPNGKNLYNDFAEFPFDTCITIPKECQYVVCFDVTDSERKQIRYVNWSKQNVFYSVDKDGSGSEDRMEAKADEEVLLNREPLKTNQIQVAKVIANGVCGKEVKYSISGDGVLRLYGVGATYDYHSLKCAPWYTYRDSIVKIEIEDGITVFGNQLFRNLTKVERVEIPKTVVELKENVFIGCSSLREVVIPSSISKIGKYCFWGTCIEKIEYNGTAQQKNEMQIGSWNTRLVACLIQ